MKCAAKILLLAILVMLLSGCSRAPNIRYRVTGTAEEVSIRFVDKDGERSEPTVVKLPYELEFKTSSSFDFQIYATNISGRGEIKCEVFADDRRLGDARGKVFAGCEGSYEQRGNDTQVRFTGYDDVIPEGYEPPSVKLPEGVSGAILFAGEEKDAGYRNFYIYDLSKGGKPIQITDGLGPSSSCPRLSPDGKQLAFVYSGSVFDLFVLHLENGDLTNLTNDGKDSLEEFCVDWAPDGSQIIFTAGKKEAGDWFYQVYSAKPDGSGITQLTANTVGDVRYRNAVWSPDGKRIAFLDNLGHEVYVINADGSDQTSFGDIENLVQDFHWSPDGTRIVFACHGGLDNIGEGVCIMNSDGSGLVKAEDASLEDIYYTAWSPDGTKIAFAGSKGGSTNIYLLNPDGTGLTQVTNFQGLVPRWISWISSVELPDAALPVSIGQ